MKKLTLDDLINCSKRISNLYSQLSNLKINSKKFDEILEYIQLNVEYEKSLYDKLLYLDIEEINKIQDNLSRIIVKKDETQEFLEILRIINRINLMTKENKINQINDINKLDEDFLSIANNYELCAYFLPNILASEFKTTKENNQTIIVDENEFYEYFDNYYDIVELVVRWNYKKNEISKYLYILPLSFEDEQKVLCNLKYNKNNPINDLLIIEKTCDENKKEKISKILKYINKAYFYILIDRIQNIDDEYEDVNFDKHLINNLYKYLDNNYKEKIDFLIKQKNKNCKTKIKILNKNK